MLTSCEKGGQFIALKSSKGGEELEEAQFAINVLGGKLAMTFNFDLPENAGERQMIVIDKQRQTAKSIRENLVHLINLLYLKIKQIKITSNEKERMDNEKPFSKLFGLKIKKTLLAILKKIAILMLNPFKLNVLCQIVINHDRF